MQHQQNNSLTGRQHTFTPPNAPHLSPRRPTHHTTPTPGPATAHQQDEVWISTEGQSIVAKSFFYDDDSINTNVPFDMSLRGVLGAIYAPLYWLWYAIQDFIIIPLRFKWYHFTTRRAARRTPPARQGASNDPSSSPIQSLKRAFTLPGRRKTTVADPYIELEEGRLRHERDEAGWARYHRFSRIHTPGQYNDDWDMYEREAVRPVL